MLQSHYYNHMNLNALKCDAPSKNCQSKSQIHAKMFCKDIQIEKVIHPIK